VQHQSIINAAMDCLLQWISAQEGPMEKKHQGWAHPLCTLVLHYAVASTVTFGVHDLLMSAPNDDNCQLSTDENYILDSKLVALGVILYAIWLLLWRLHHASSSDHQSGVLYEYTWLCNVTLVLGALALLLNRPIVATAHCVAVGIDQLMWYVDLVAWALSGFTKFPIGVAKYVTWPGTSFATRLTCTHHLWTIPLFVTAARGVHPAALSLSVVIVVVNVLLSRWLTPFSLPNKYLNVNLAHELWRDVKIEILQINHDDPPVILYLFRLLWRWQCFNLLVFFFLHTSSGLLFGSAPTCIQ
jgi:hypothetical protein